MYKYILLTFLSLISLKQTFAQLNFIKNAGQWNNQIEFKTHIYAGEAFFEKDGFRFLLYDDKKVQELHKRLSTDTFLNCHAFKIKFLNSNPNVHIKGISANQTKYNYFVGNNTQKWASNVSSFQKIYYTNLYNNIDLEVFSFQGNMKYNFILHPGANPKDIKISYNGVDDVWIENGKLFTMTSLRKIWENEPYSIQSQKDGTNKIVGTEFVLDGNIVSFNIKGNYQKERILTIDPTLVFGTFSGSTADNFGFTGTYDKQGNGYSGGTVYEFGFPTTLGAYQINWHSGANVNRNIGDIPRDIGILKYSSDGTQLLYATYLGGTHNEDPHSMVVNNKGELLIFGNTGSADFPTTLNAYDTSYNGNYDIFVAKLSADGSQLLSSTFVGGSNRDGLNGRQAVINNRFDNISELGFNYGDVYRGEIITNDQNEVYINTTTLSDDFPISTNALQGKIAGQHDICLLKLSPNLDKLIASSFYGGSKNDAGYGIALDSSNNIYICGGTESTNIPMLNTTYQDTFQGLPTDGIIAHISSNLDTVLHATYFGTSRYDQTYFVQLDRNNNVYVTGQTTDTLFPVKDVKYWQKNGKQFISKLNPELDSLIYSTKFGSGRFFPDLSPSAFLVDVCERVYFSGWGGQANFNGNSSGLEITKDHLKDTTDGSDFYLAVFNKNIDSLIYSSYFGGDTSAEHVDGGTSRFSKQGIVYQSVCGGCGGGLSDFPTTKGAVSETNNAITGNLCNNAFFKIEFALPLLIADFEIPELLCNEDEIKPINRSAGATTYKWFFGDGASSTDANPTHKYQDTGVFEITMIVSNPVTCLNTDTLKQKVRVYKKADAAFDFIQDDCGYRTYFNYTGSKAFHYEWNLNDSVVTDLSQFEHRFDTSGQYKIQLIADKGSSCADTATKNLIIEHTEADFRYVLDSCSTKARFREETKGAFSFNWYYNAIPFSNDDDPNFTFPSDGKYQIMLKINQGTVCEDSVEKTIQIGKIDRKPSIGMQIDSCNYQVLLYNTSLIFKGSKWLIGTDSYTNDTINIKINNGGYRAIQLIVDPFSECPDTAYTAVELQKTPTANFSFEKDSCTSKVDFKNLSTNAISYQWIIQNKKYNSTDVSHTFTDTGSFSVQLIANPFSACADTSTQIIDNRNNRFAAFEINIDSCKLSVDITNNSMNAREFNWYFSDGFTSQLKDLPTKTFLHGGKHSITLVTDINNAECTDSFSISFTLDSLPIAEIDTQLTYCKNQIQFINQSKNAVNFNWQFGDNQTSTDKNPTHEYQEVGNYTISLNAISKVGCKDIAYLDIQIDSLQQAKAIAEIDTCTGVVHFSANDGFKNYEWLLNDSLISNEQSFEYKLFGQDNDYHIKLICNKDLSCIDSTSLIIHIPIISKDNLIIPNVFTPNSDGINDVFRIAGISSKCLDAKLIIYNRWGEKLFESDKNKLVWNGLNQNNKPYAAGTYYYLLYIGNEDVIEGTITLLR